MKVYRLPNACSVPTQAISVDLFLHVFVVTAEEKLLAGSLILFTDTWLGAGMTIDEQTETAAVCTNYPEA